MRPRIWPLFLIFLGLVFLAANLGVVSFGELKRILAVWWPVILIAVGIAGLARKR